MTLERSAPLKRGKPLKRTEFHAARKPAAARRRKPTRDPIPAKVRLEVRARAMGHCEMPGCWALIDHLHHRKLRRFGDHSAENLMALCHPHHGHVHANPDLSYERGWLIRGNGVAS